jgi:hypothetical protein
VGGAPLRQFDIQAHQMSPPPLEHRASSGFP